MQPRECPHCYCILPLESGFKFDKNFNLICDECGEVVFLTGEKVEKAEKTTKIETNALIVSANFPENVSLDKM